MKLGLCFTTLAAIVVPALCFAGPGSTGGGTSIVCRDASQNIVSAELLDLYEARILSGLSIPADDRQHDLQLEDAIVRASNVSPRVRNSNHSGILRDLQNGVRAIKAKTKFLSGVTLKPTDDAEEVAAPRGCNVEQTATYTDQGSVLIDADIWAVMDETNKAALYLHESLYAILRKLNGDRTSVHTRRTVGLVFSGHNFMNFVSQLPAKYIDCSHQIYFFETGNGLAYIPMTLGQERLYDLNSQGAPKTLAEFMTAGNAEFQYKIEIDSLIEKEKDMRFFRGNDNGSVYFKYGNVNESYPDPVKCWIQDNL